MQGSELQISIIVPTQDSAQFIQDTCESLIAQKNCSWEAIFVDAGSIDRTIEIINSYKEPRFRIQVFSGASLFALMNRGIMLAKAEYVHLLLEGCTYLSSTALSTALQKLEEAKRPDLFYTASYVGDRGGAMHLYYLHEAFSRLQDGFQPALLQACFFQTSLFKKMGYFRCDLIRRSALDFFCRLKGRSDVHIASDCRVVVEMFLFPPRFLQSGLLYKETQAVILRYFGWLAALRWRLYAQFQPHTRKRFQLDLVLSGVKGSGPKARVL